MNLVHWIHHLFNPHCTECSYESAEKKVCQSCETLKMQLNIANSEKERILEALLEKSKPVEVANAKVPGELKEVRKALPWHVRRQMLESEDRETARILREKAERDKNIIGTPEPKPVEEQISELEKELGVEEDAQPSNLHR